MTALENILSVSRSILPSALEHGEEDLFIKEYALSASDDEGGSDDERKHRKLLEAISSLDGKKRRKLAERTEASAQVSEFSVSSEGAGEKIYLSELLKPIKPSSSLVTVKKQLNKLKTKKTVELPLSKQETQRIQREVAYEKTSKDITKWDRVVLQNRKADQLVFPLNQEGPSAKPIEEVISKWKARTPLEQEIFNILHKNRQPLTDPLLTPVEEASLKAMSLDEAKQRREELQKARALQSYYESKARRERRIKSKKYHKVLKKGKRKDALKEFEELRKTNPEAALEELQKMDKTRIMERMSLKHQNSGKWAKSKVLMGKYDLEARKAMQEQLEKNKELTKKLEILSDSEEEVVADEDTIPDFVNEVEMTKEGPNPWMLGRLSRDANDNASQEEAKQLTTTMDTERNSLDEKEEDKELSEDEALLQEFEDKRCLRKKQESEHGAPKEAETGFSRDNTSEVEDEQLAEYNSLFQRLVEQGKQPHGPKKGPDNHRNTSVESAVSYPHKQKEQEQVDDLSSVREEGPLLTERLERTQTLEEVGNLGREEWGEDEILQARPEEKQQGAENTNPSAEQPKKKKKKMIDPSAVIAVHSQVLRTPVLPTAVEEEDDDEDQKMIIQEAFAGDNVIDDFLKDKRNAEKAGKPKDIDLTLPGWGEWGGTGLKLSKKKRKRFIIKAAPGPPRKDERLPNVIINEKRDIAVAAHQVNELPFPFNNREQFEGSIRAPIGTAWNTQRAFQKLTAPRVITKQGHIIEPISEEDAFQKQSQKVKPAFELDPNKFNAKDARRNKSRKYIQKQQKPL
ncbi:U3 small nucleolar RNA-associated protein 14 homolog A [Ambystoma mexicanum]|uniref:U3 small nucleolar RNA-associated protein 14 homolog A n=1 Tax=Ambystoma mexicanum TaxID=8296 RepID=UPI0037E7D4BB